MLKVNTISMLLTCLFVCTAALSSSAHDVVAPPWRGSPLSTCQNWHFSTSANPALPDVLTNPYGQPSASIAVGQYGSGWLNKIPGLGTQTGYWDLGSSGTIQTTVPNAPPEAGASSGWVSVQVTYFKDITAAPTVAVAGGTMMSATSQTIESVATGGHWLLDQSLWRLPSCPAAFAATVTSSAQWGSVIDELVIDAIRVDSASGAGGAKQLDDGDTVELSETAVTRTFGTFFYIEDVSRISGIRVNCASGQSVPAQGTAPVIVGTLRTIDGERVIDGAYCYGSTTMGIPDLLMMTTKSAAALPSPVGLRVKVAGHASVSSPGATVFSVDDGSGTPLRVQLYGVSAPEHGRVVSVTGVLGADGYGAILRANSTDTVTTYW